MREAGANTGAERSLALICITLGPKQTTPPKKSIKDEQYVYKHSLNQAILDPKKVTPDTHVAHSRAICINTWAIPGLNSVDLTLEYRK